MTEEQAYELTVNNEMFYGCLMLKSGDVDGLVGGATFSSADVLRSAFQVIKPAPGIKSVSSCFVIVPPEGNTVTDAPAMIFSDCAVIPEPDENQLADVAVAAADSARSIVGIEPKVAMLSFSTKGSAKHERIDKVVHALNIVKESHPELDIDGEMQLDAAIVPVVAKQKAPGSTVAGHANVLVSRIWNRAISATKSHNVSAAAWQSAPLCKVLQTRQRPFARMRCGRHRCGCGNHRSSIQIRWQYENSRYQRGQQFA